MYFYLHDKIVHSILNILILNYEFPPLGGGAGIVTQHLATQFIELNHHVTILTTWFANEPEYHTENNLTIIRLKSKRKLTYQSNPLEMYDWMQKAKKYAAQYFTTNQFDICLANFTLPGGAVAYFLENKFKLPYIIVSHGHDIPWFSPKQMFFWHLLFFPVIRFLMKHASYNVVLTSQLKINADKFIGNKHANKNIVIPNGVFPYNLRSGFDSKDAIINALFVGRLVAQKDPITVLKSFKQLQQLNIPIHLKIIGDGELKSEIEEFISKNNLNNIEVLGKISQSSVLEEYTKAHVLLAPSREEAMSLSVLEAVAAGLYIFATKVSGNKEVILENVNGDFVDYNNAEMITQRVQSFYVDKFLKNYQYPDLMINFMEQNYTWESTAKKYVDIFNELLNTNSK